MACYFIHLLSLAAVATAAYDQLRDRPFDSQGSQPFIGSSGPAVSIDRTSLQLPELASAGAHSFQFGSEPFRGASLNQLTPGGTDQFGFQQLRPDQFSTGASGLTGPLSPGQSFGGSSTSSFTSGQGSGNVIFGQGSSFNAPTYEEHVLPRSGPLQLTTTVTNFVTKTHTLRVPATSDVWITSVTMVKVPVTQLTTQRNFVRGVADTVTSFVRITSTPVSVATRTVEVFPTKTMVSVFTNFVTKTETVELWQPIQHLSTSYDVITRPILETQTLLQRAFRTVAVTQTVDVTSTRQLVFPRSGRVSVPPRNYLF